MQDSVAVVPGAGLSEGARLIDTFVAPTKTFTDIFRSAAIWGPLVIMLFCSVFYSYSIQKKVGFDAVSQQQLEKVPAQAEKIDAMPPDQKARVMQMRAKGTEFTTYGFAVLILIFVAIHALILWASFNFVLGAKTTYPQVFAVIMYAGLPKIFVSIIGSILLWANVGIDNFDVQNPVGTNIGYFLSGTVAKAAGSFFDIFGLWSLAVLVIGMAVISKKTTAQSAAVVVGWWVLGLLISVGMTAAFA